MIHHATHPNIRSLIRAGKIRFGGNKILKIYGTLSCSSGKRMKAENRVFFESEAEARLAGYRPCGHCMKDQPPAPILPKDGEVLFIPNFFSLEESDLYLSRLSEEIAWKQEPIKIFGKTVLQPRLTAWYGDSGKTYSYSGITLLPIHWTHTLLEIKRRIEGISPAVFNSALLNQYRDQQDSMGWHRDNEKELGPNPVIGSVSFGAPRVFRLRHYKDKSLTRSLELTHGSLLIMSGPTQHFWEHSVPKQSVTKDTRINITFRKII